MYTFDQILASSYYIYRDKLTPKEVLKNINNLKTLGFKINRTMNKDKLNGIIEFNQSNYFLNPYHSIEEIKPFIDTKLIILFNSMKSIIDNNKKVYSFDEIIATGISIFGELLNIELMTYLVTTMKRLNMPIKRNLIKNKTSNIVDYDNYYYIVDGYSITDIKDYIDEDLAVIMTIIALKYNINKDIKKR